MSARWDPQVNAPAPTGVDAHASATLGLDPYFRWAEHTAWRGMRSQVAWGEQDPFDEHVQIIARAQDTAALRAALAEPKLNIPPVYGQRSQRIALQRLGAARRLALAA
jgi:hypothetical protein